MVAEVGTVGNVEEGKRVALYNRKICHNVESYGKLYI
jgi:hypothetical protein